MRAVACSGAGLGLTLVSVTVGKVLADLATAADRALQGDDPVADYAPPLQPLPRDRDDFDEAMRWFVRLNPPDAWQSNRAAWAPNRMQRVVIMRALPVPMSFQEIADQIGRKKQRAQQIYDEAIGKCVRLANESETTSPQIIALRERNRQHRLRSQ